MVPKVLPLSTAVILTEDSEIEDRFGHLLELLERQGVQALVVHDAAAATEQLQRSSIGEVQCVLIDSGPIAEEVDVLSDTCLDFIRAMATELDVDPIVVSRSPSPEIILSAFRAGASDLIDLDDESDDYVLDILHQTALEHYRRVQRRKRVQNLRVILEDLLKHLIQTERRTIDLEYMLAARDDDSQIAEDFIPNRPPTVLVVDDDHDMVMMLVELLEAAELETHACSTGEEAVAQVQTMAEQGKAVDMVIADIRMPGMSGLDTIRELRTIKPNLTAMLMTGFSDVDTAVDAVELGVVGYVRKPFDDTRELVARVKKSATKSMNDARGLHYLEQIKQRHAKVLLRYQRLVVDLQQLVI